MLMLNVVCNCTIHMLTLQLVTCPKKFPEQRGVVCAEVVDKNNKRSPLMQGGLEAIQALAEMDLAEMNKAILAKCRQIVVSGLQRTRERWPLPLLYKKGAERTVERT